MLAPEDCVVVGRVVGVHGVKGWVKVFSHTHPMENILQYRPWFLEGSDGWEQVDVQDGRRHGKGLIARLGDCRDRDQANERFVGRQIAIHRDSLPEPGDNEFYWRDLIGLRVVLQDQRELGTVSTLMETGANDVLVVRGDSDSLDERERLIPWIPDQVILGVDRDSGTLTVDWDPEF
jgi:16S rRNA processing protein RimM